MVETGIAEVRERLDSLERIDPQQHIKRITTDVLDDCVALCGRCFEFSKFDGEFDPESTAGTIQAIKDGPEHLAICYEEDGEIIGIGIFMLVPSVVNVNHKKLYEVAWDACPNIHHIKKGRVMVAILRYVLEYYKGLADTAHFSVPCDNTSVRMYLFNRGFTPKEVHYAKELR